MNTKLCEELSALSLETYSLRDSDKKLSETRPKMYAINRNGNKKLRRRDRIIQKQVKHLAGRKEVIRNLEHKVTQSESQVSSLEEKFMDLVTELDIGNSSVKI